LSYYQKRAILPYVLFLVMAAMFVGQMEPNEDAFCQVWFHLAQLFQRSRLKYEKANKKGFLTFLSYG
jgi:hypothetical protein